MRIVLAALPAMLLAPLAAHAAPPLADLVRAAIAGFAPLEPGPRDALRGSVVGIDAAPVPVADARQRLCDDLGLLTAAHLYHFVRQAGGMPVLLRADRAGDADPAAALEWRTLLLARARCDILLTLRFETSGQPGVLHPAGGEPPSPSARLAEALAAALDLAPAAGGERPAGLPPTGAPAACTELRLACPAGAASVTPELRRHCLTVARQLCMGLARFHASPPGAAPAPAEPPGVPDTPSSDRRGNLERAARGIWPEGPLPPARLDWFCRRFARECLTNRSLVFFDVTAAVEGDEVVLSGRTSVPAVVGGLERALRSVGVQHIRSAVVALPDRARLGPHVGGACCATTALTYDRPDPTAGVQTQLLLGECVWLLDRVDGWYLLHGGDGYWGWVRQAAIAPMDAAQFAAYRARPAGVVMVDVDAPEARVPRSAVLPVPEVRDDACVLQLPDGTLLEVPRDAVRVDAGAAARAEARVRAALDLLYAPYVFGGRGPLGLDCSGLAHHAATRLGEVPARDAWQQALAGRLVATGWHRDGLEPGDQLFFINETGKVYHTGIALDALHFVHSAPPCVQIASFDPASPLYDAVLDRDLLLAKRP